MPGGRSIAGRLKGSDAVEKQGTTGSGMSLDLQMLRDLNARNQLQAEQVQTERNRTVLQIDQKILFRPGSTELNPEALGYLTEIADYLKENRKEIEIRGHTDFFEGVNQSEWSEHSWRISLRRAQSIYSFFQLRGIDVNRMSCHGYSYYRPAVSSQEYPHLSDKNQRVEIVVGPNERLPAHLAQEGRTASRGINYKNFFFRLFPEKEKASVGTDGEKVDIYEWLKENSQ
jgi:chemotaxis protein MotB